MPETKTAEISGPRKAAVFLVSIDQESASRIFAQLDKSEIERLGLEIAKLEAQPVNREERDKILEEFYHLHLAQQYIEHGGIGYARTLLEKVLPAEEVRKIIETIEQSLKATPFNFLHKTETEDLLTFVQDEHPQTIALILAYLIPSQSAEILERLPIKKQQDVIKRLANMQHTSPEVVERVEKALQAKLASIVTHELSEAGGVKQAAEILNLTQRTTEKTILEGLEEEDPELVENIRRLMFTFDDILRVNDRGVQNLLRQIDPQQLALSLKAASPELKDKFFKNMSKRAVENIKEELEFMGPVRLSDVEGAQQAIVEVVRKLEEQGDLVIEGRGGAEEIIV
jgi:flagellar motor switch protein FliG